MMDARLTSSSVRRRPLSCCSMISSIKRSRSCRQPFLVVSSSSRLTLPSPAALLPPAGDPGSLSSLPTDSLRGKLYTATLCVLMAYAGCFLPLAMRFLWGKHASDLGQNQM
jgi:hypothetical protein